MFYFSNDLIKNPYCSDTCLKQISEGKIQCKCGEDKPVFDWTWHEPRSATIQVSNHGRDVLFNPVYSCGTAAVRGTTPFKQNHHYYWEIKILSKLYGTDCMIGVGTSNVDLKKAQFRFCSILGMDNDSWGYSYQGRIYHGQLQRMYGREFNIGSLIGVYLDMCNGTLEFYLNRTPLGIAFKDLKGKELYPMVSSTAAQSAMRLTCCMSRQQSLQIISLKRILENQCLYEEYKTIPSLKVIYERQVFWMKPQITKCDEKKRLAELEEEVAEGCIGKTKKVRKIRKLSLLEDMDNQDDKAEDSDIDVYDFSHIFPNICEKAPSQDPPS
ncbi:SPRY domain-containing SOCS box protein 3 [Anthonomus grandis grandis]|uniref:SPRY domain-containing SOCS box protein 3 n=1 Tax=Anthonomus grandis grandis TaxID=2921223 RepID=UPI00216574F3|nr:SPRY domain-containing SOCS box protein 3 [Anthonomus grandis grandis]